MTLERQINDLIESNLYLTKIENWFWVGQPHSKIIEFKTWNEIIKKIDGLIKYASPEMCLTSPSQYIRECKRYYDSRTNYNKYR